jgi:hypothetical protein
MGERFNNREEFTRHVQQFSKAAFIERVKKIIDERIRV